jgi:Tetratricopeptide repeat
MMEAEAKTVSRRSLSIGLALAVAAGLVALGWLSLSRGLSASTATFQAIPFGPEPGTRIGHLADFTLTASVNQASPKVRVLWEEAAEALTGNAKVRDQALAALAAEVEPESFAPLAYGLALAGAFDVLRGRDDAVALPKTVMQALERDKHPFARYALGRLFEANGRHADARTAYEQAIATAPDFAYAWSRLGYASLSLDDLPMARRAFRMAIGLFASDSLRYRNIQATPAEARLLPRTEAPPYGGLALLYLAEHKADTAAQVLALGEEQVEKRVEGQSEKGGSARGTSPGILGAELALAHACWWEYKGHIAKARAGYDSLIGEYPRWEAAQRLRETLGLKGSAEPEGREALFAIQTLDPLVKAYPRNAPLRLALAKAYAKRELHGMAVMQLDSALALDPQLPEGENLRNEAYDRWMSQESRAGSSALTRAASAAAARVREDGSGSDGQDRAIVPGSMALLGTYGVSWAASSYKVREAYPEKTFLPTAGGHLIDRYVFEGLLHENLLAFRNDSLYGVLAQVSDTSNLSIDVFGRMIRIKTKISGEGKGTGEASCAGYRSFQGAIWENDDTFEFMAQFQGKENQIRLARVARWALPQDRRLCDLVRYLDRNTWEMGPTPKGKTRLPEAALRPGGKGQGTGKSTSALKQVKPTELTGSAKPAKKREPIDIAPMPSGNTMPPRPPGGKAQAPGTGVPIITPASPDFDIDPDAAAFDQE